MNTAHIIGAGLAGLSAAMRLTEAGYRVILHEAGPAAGGRCRSYFDRALDCRIDNGNHLLLSGNEAAMAYLHRIGARDTMTGPGRAVFPFMDLITGERWTVEPGASRVPWWVLNSARRVPGTKLFDYLAIVRLGMSRGTVAKAIGGSTLYSKLLEPLAVSVLNTPTESAMSKLMWAVVQGTLLRGGDACIPLVPRIGLSESFIDPALAWLEARGAKLHTSQRVTAFEQSDRKVTALHTTTGANSLTPNDLVVLAAPAWIAADLLPGLIVPNAFEAILNVHFKVDTDPGATGFIGLVGGTAEWIFIKPGIVSVTISAANRLLDTPQDTLADFVWHDVTCALNMSGDMPPVRVVREKRATFAATEANEKRRPGPRPGGNAFPRNLALAGDWTATGLPATIEGAIRSGITAAESLLTAPMH